MEQLIAELRKKFSFKNTTVSGDIVLLVAQDQKWMLYARVGNIARDDSRKEEWWHVTLHLLTIPLQTVVWTLRTPQFTGQESFTMGGEGRFIQALQFEDTPPLLPTEPHPSTLGGKCIQRKGLRVVK